MKRLLMFFLFFATCAVFSEMPKRGLCAHQGDNACFPHNTIPAVESAVKKGAAMIEFDVKRCKTGELVIMHDPTVDRTTNGTGKVSDLTFDEIRALDAGIKRSNQFVGTKVPTFDEVIDIIPKDGIWINCHVDHLDVALEVAQKIKEKGRLHQAFIATSASYVSKLRAAVPDIMTCNMSRTGTRKESTWTPEVHHKYAQTTVDRQCNFIQIIFLCPQSDIKLMKDAGVKIAFFSCNSPDKLQELLDAGVEYVLTDRLDEMTAKWKELEAQQK